MRRDPLIIGGGPAGAAAAITLARAGNRPVVIERSTGPTDKVCGDFLSMDTVRRARGLGVDPTALGAVPIHRIRLIHRQRTAEAALPFPAFGLSRRTFDAALLKQAESVGAIVRTGQTVRTLKPEAGTWVVQAGDQTTWTAETVFLATGKHDLRNLPRSQGERGAVGMKMYFVLAPEPAEILDGAVELTLFPGGYAGMQHIENGQVVLCVAIRRRAFRHYGGGWATLVSAIGQSCPRFAMMLAGARPLLPRPIAVAGIPYGHLAGPVAADGLFRVGDQTAVIPSLTGDGMAIALHSGRTAAEFWLSGASSTAYHRTLTRGLAPQMRLAGLLHHLCLTASVQPAAIRAAALFPSLLRHAARRTRLRLDLEQIGQPIPA